MAEEIQQDACLLAYQRWQAHNPKVEIFPMNLIYHSSPLARHGMLSMMLPAELSPKEDNEHHSKVTRAEWIRATI